jgi:hypothetical protein
MVLHSRVDTFAMMRVQFKPILVSLYMVGISSSQPHVGCAKRKFIVCRLAKISITDYIILRQQLAAAHWTEDEPYGSIVITNLRLSMGFFGTHLCNRQDFWVDEP